MMENEEYLLIEWIGENTYSTVSKEQIVDGTQRQKSGDQLVGLTLDFVWGKQEFRGCVIQYGSKINMDHEVLVYAQEESERCGLQADQSRKTEAALVAKTPSKSKVNRRRKTTQCALQNEIVLESISNVMNKLPEYGQDTVQETNENDPEILRDQLSLAEAKAAKYKRLAKRRRKKILEMNAIQANSNIQMVEIGTGVSEYVCKSQLDTIKILSETPNTFARNLMRLLFTTDELKIASLFGKSCPANRLLYPQRPELDPVRRDAIILYTLRSFGGDAGNVKQRNNLMLRGIKISLSDFLRETRSKI